MLFIIELYFVDLRRWTFMVYGIFWMTTKEIACFRALNLWAQDHNEGDIS